MPERTLFHAASPEVAYLITRDRTFPGTDPDVALVARRGGLPGGTAVEVVVDEKDLTDLDHGRYLAPRALLTSDRIGRAFQPWHADIEPDSSARWKGYLQPRSITLRNLIGADTPNTLRGKEDNRVEARYIEMAARPVKPTLDLMHLREIHRRLFQDVYPWAGETRTVNMGRPGGPGFVAWDDIEESWERIGQIADQLGHAKGTPHRDFVEGLAQVYNSVNTVHAFREGNGRTQRVWLSAYAENCGFSIDWKQIGGRINDGISLMGREGKIQPMIDVLDPIVSPRDRPEPTARTALEVSRSSFPQGAGEATRAGATVTSLTEHKRRTGRPEAQPGAERDR